MQIDVNLTRTAADLITEFGAGAKLYLYSAATEAGVYSLVGTGTPLVSGTERYEIIDTAGVPGTTWYKTRVGNTGATLFTEYSTPWQSTALLAYATLDDLRETMDFPDSSRDNYLTDLLIRASAFIDGQCGRRFYRDPQVSGTTTKTFRIRRGADTLSRSVGQGVDIVSVTTLELASETGGTFSTLTTGSDYSLIDPERPGWPAAELVLHGNGSYPQFYSGYGVARVVGVFGFSSVPEMVKAATIDLAREWYRQGPGGGPSQVGINQFGVPVYLTGYPPTVRTVIDPLGPYRLNSFAWV